LGEKEFERNNVRETVLEYTQKNVHFKTKVIQIPMMVDRWRALSDAALFRGKDFRPDSPPKLSVLTVVCFGIRPEYHPIEACQHGTAIRLGAVEHPAPPFIQLSGRKRGD
jgi:hypothetical protein